MFEGTLTALVTPFRKNEVDQEAMRALVERQIAAGIHGLVVCGTTGEAVAMSDEEQLTTIRLVVDQVRGRVPVVAGTGTNNTRHSIELTRRAAALKVDGVLVVTPYYTKPTQRGLIEHFRQVAAVGVPVIAYNVPGRTGVALAAPTVGALAEIKNLVALKEASGDLNLDSAMLLTARDRLSLLSGDDFTFLPLLSIGGQGCISVLSNVVPRETAEIYNRWKAGDVAAARALHFKLFPLMQALFSESNPIPVKAAMAMLGLCTREIRTPLSELAEEHRPKLAKALADLGLIGGLP